MIDDMLNGAMPRANTRASPLVATPLVTTPLVTTIVPAWNTAATLAETLASALAQTYPAHEIVVIDDGSSDATPRIAEEHARRHPAIRVVRQENRGLPGARNRGIDEARGAFVAPLDADDLWHPEKIARQVAALKAAPDAALAYGWFRRIDEAGRVLPGSAAPRVEGNVLHRHLAANFVSNGSSPLIRTDVARAIRYDERYRSAEDYLFQLEVARRHAFACVPAYLTGYRLATASMSRDVARMIRWHVEMFEQLMPDLPPAARRIARRRIARLQVELARNRLRRRHVGSAVSALVRGATLDPVEAARTIGGEARTALSRLHRPMFPPPARAFADYGAEEPDTACPDDGGAAADPRLAALDRGTG